MCVVDLQMLFSQKMVSNASIKAFWYTNNLKVAVNRLSFIFEQGLFFFAAIEAYYKNVIIIMIKKCTLSLSKFMIHKKH